MLQPTVDYSHCSLGSVVNAVDFSVLTNVLPANGRRVGLILTPEAGTRIVFANGLNRAVPYDVLNGGTIVVLRRDVGEIVTYPVYMSLDNVAVAEIIDDLGEYSYHPQPPISNAIRTGK